MDTQTRARHTPEELIAAGRADTVKEAKRLMEIMRLEEMNTELLDILKGTVEQFEDYIENKVILGVYPKIEQAKRIIAKAEGRG